MTSDVHLGNSVWKLIESGSRMLIQMANYDSRLNGNDSWLRSYVLNSKLNSKQSLKSIKVLFSTGKTSGSGDPITCGQLQVQM